jgi:hypothetical protein
MQEEVAEERNLAAALGSSDSPDFVKFFAKETDASRCMIPTKQGTGKRKGVIEKAGL